MGTALGCADAQLGDTEHALAFLSPRLTHQASDGAIKGQSPVSKPAGEKRSASRCAYARASAPSSARRVNTLTIARR